MTGIGTQLIVLALGVAATAVTQVTNSDWTTGETCWVAETAKRSTPLSTAQIDLLREGRIRAAAEAAAREGEVLLLSDPVEGIVAKLEDLVTASSTIVTGTVLSCTSYIQGGTYPRVRTLFLVEVGETIVKSSR